MLQAKQSPRLEDFPQGAGRLSNSSQQEWGDITEHTRHSVETSTRSCLCSRGELAQNKADCDLTLTKLSNKP